MIRKLTLAAVFMGLTLTLGSCDTAEERAEKHFQSALALIEQGDLERARVEFRNVFELNPQHREARMTLARILLEAGDRVNAMRQLNLVVEQFPDDAEAMLILTEVALEAQDWQIAARFGRRLSEVGADPDRTAVIETVLDYRDAVIAQDPQARRTAAEHAAEMAQNGNSAPILLKTLVDWQMNQERPREALETLDKLIAQNPDEIQNYFVRLQVLQQLGEDPEIARELRELVKKFPEDATVRQSLIAWHLRRNEMDEVEAFLRELITEQEGPERVLTQVSLVDFLRRYRSAAAAVAEIDKILADTTDPDRFRAFRANLMFAMGDRDAAVALMEDILAGAEPSEMTRRYKVGLAVMQRTMGNAVAARALIEEVLADDPTDVEAIKEKARFLIEGDKPDEAISLLRVALDQAPRDASVMTMLAQAHERMGDRDLMGEMLALAAEASGRAPEESLRLSNFLVSQNQLPAAETALIGALRQNPDNIDLLMALGRVNVGMEKFADAANVENRLRTLEDERAKAAADQVRLLSLKAQNRNEDIISMMQDLSADSNDATRSALTLMGSQLGNKDVEAAAKTLAEAQAARPDDLQLKFAEGVLAGLQDDDDKARRIFREVTGAAPNATRAWLALARSYSSKGDDAQAEAVLEEALAALPDIPAILWAKAGYLERRGDIGGAIEIYERLYDASTSSVVIANNLASLLSSYSDDPETIERAYVIARRLRGLPQPQFQDTYGWIAYQRGELEEALHHLEPAAEKLPGDPLVQYHLGRVYEALDRDADAKRQYEKSIEILGAGSNEAMADVQVRLAEVKATVSAPEN